MSGRFWLVVPIIVEGGGLAETDGEPAAVVGYPCRVFSRENRGASVNEQWLLFNPLPREEAEALLARLRLMVPVLSIRLGRDNGSSFEVPNYDLMTVDSGFCSLHCPTLIPEQFEPNPQRAYGFISTRWVVNELMERLEHCPAQYDDRISAAFELWATAGRESQPRSRFLTYMTILDSLAISGTRPAAVVAWLGTMANAAEELRDQSLLNAIQGLSKESRSNAIQSLAYRAATAMGPPTSEACEFVCQVKRLYGVRSRLAHKGSALADETYQLQGLVKLVLEGAMFEPAILTPA